MLKKSSEGHLQKDSPNKSASRQISSASKDRLGESNSVREFRDANKMANKESFRKPPCGLVRSTHLSKQPNVFSLNLIL